MSRKRVLVVAAAFAALGFSATYAQARCCRGCCYGSCVPVYSPGTLPVPLTAPVLPAMSPRATAADYRALAQRYSANFLPGAAQSGYVVGYGRGYSTMTPAPVVGTADYRATSHFGLTGIPANLGVGAQTWRGAGPQAEGRSFSGANAPSSMPPAPNAANPGAPRSSAPTGGPP